MPWSPANWETNPTGVNTTTGSYFRFTWSKNPANMLRNPDEAILRALAATGPAVEKMLLDYKTAWSDRTGNLRRSRVARASVLGPRLQVSITQGAGLYRPYGFFVEVCWGGKYSSIVPAIYAVMPRAQAMVAAAIAGA